MNTFKRKTLTAALLAGMSAAGTANAIYQDPNGMGSYMIYPYYTVNPVDGSNFNTYISIVNTTALTKVVRFRAREGKVSAEVLDFNIYLSPNDVWAAAIVPCSGTISQPGGSQCTGGAEIITVDTSCTNPQMYPVGTSTDVRGFEFTNARYIAGGLDNPAGFAAIGASYGLDNVRTREGYVEIIELYTLDPTLANNGALTVHSAGVPPGCPRTGANAGTTNAQLLDFFTGVTLNPAPVTAVALPITGGLHGTGTLIHVATGNTMGYNATAFANWRAAPWINAIATENPNFTNGDPVSVTVAASGNPPGVVTAYRSDWVTAAPALGASQAASATIMHAAVTNEWGLDNATRSNTDWVLTFPTKRGFLTPAANVAVAPFTAAYAATVGSCEPVAFAVFNREELAPGSGPNPPICPSPFSCSPTTVTRAVCWESTVLSFRRPGTAAAPSHTAAPGSGGVSGVLGSNNMNELPVPAGLEWQNGWAGIQFTGANAAIGLISDATSQTITLPQDGTAAVMAAGAQTFLGLPVVGFAARTLQNTAVNCGTNAGCKFGTLYNHKYFNLNTP